MIEDLSSKFISLSDCFWSLTIGSAYSFGFTVRSSTTKCHELGGQFRAISLMLGSIIVRQLQSITVRDIFAVKCIRTNQVYI